MKLLRIVVILTALAAAFAPAALRQAQHSSHTVAISRPPGPGW